METVTWLLIVAVVIVLFLYDYWKKSHFKRLGIPCDLRPMPFIGHYHKLLSQGLNQTFANMRKLPNKVNGFFFGNSPIVVVGDADIAKEIMIRSFAYFYNRSDQPIDDYPLNKGLTALQGSRWKKVRNTITPAFSASKMKPIASHLNVSCDTLIKHLKVAIASNPDVEVKAMYGKMTMDSIAKAGFGLEVDSQGSNDSPFVKHAKALVDLDMWNPVLILMVFVPKVAPILNYFNIGLISRKAKKFFMDVTQQAMQMRQDEGSKRVDILQLMVNAHKTNESSDEPEDIPDITGIDEKDLHQKTELTDGEIMAQTLLFFFAGYETTNVALSFFSYNLALHPELQEKLYQEIQELAPDRDSVTYDTVNKMEYLDMFLSESLRMFPPASVADRVCQEPITLGGYRFEKGQHIFINIIAIHHDPDYWEDPEKFIPERFTKEAKENRHPCVYLPFGTGPRNCIGMRFALLVLKLSIVRVVQNFKFEPCEKTQIPVTLGSTALTPAEGITLRVIARE